MKNAPQRVRHRHQRGASSAWTILAAAIVFAAMMGTAVYILLGSGNDVYIGMCAFVGAPILAAYPASIVAPDPIKQMIGAFLGYLLLCIPISMMAIEGVLCLAMAGPLVFMMNCAGIGMVSLARKALAEAGYTRRVPAWLLIALTPFVLAAGAEIEKGRHELSWSVNAESSTVVNATPERVWKALTEMTELSGEPSALMKLGLPIPRRCELSEVQVGAKRSCHFDEGVIRQRITDLETNRRFEVDVLESTLKGREWMTFSSAGYRLEVVAGGTKVTRWTRYESRLEPRIYWKPLEVMGMNSMHDYVLRDPKNQAEALR